MKKQKRIVLALLCALVLSTGSSGMSVDAHSVGSIIKEAPTMPPSDVTETADPPAADSGDSGGSSGSSDSKRHGLDSSKLDSAVDTVTAGSTVDAKSMSKAKKVLAPFGNFLKLLAAIAFTLVALWIPLTFAADILVGFIPFLDKYIGSGSGGGGAGGPGGGGKGFHFQLTSSHSLRGGGAGGPGGGGGGGLDFGSYFKARAKELVWAFTIIGLMVSGLYSVLLAKIIEYVALIVVAILNLVFDIADGFLK